MPSPDQVRAFVQSATRRVGPREIARAFGLGPELRRPMRALLHGLRVDATAQRRAAPPTRIVGVFRSPGRVDPAHPEAHRPWHVPAGADGGAEDGELVLATPLPQGATPTLSARIVGRLGPFGGGRSLSIATRCIHGLPDGFPDDAAAEAAAAAGVGPCGREDLRALPFVTVDREDARDLDDAIFAERTPDGFRVVVAVADVAHYVRPGSPLDQAARSRGNSVYFPDLCVPMLPDALSARWCSLLSDEDRGCLFADIRIDADGATTAHRFGRGLMRSRRRLTYGALEAAADANDGLGLPGAPIAALYAVLGALLTARAARGALDLDRPERHASLDAAGEAAAIAFQPRLRSHRLVEEVMVLANTAAAAELDRLGQPCLYRVHAAPAPDRLRALRRSLLGIGLALPPGPALAAHDLSQLLRAAADRGLGADVAELVLRSQSAAAYSHSSAGHFGLGLARYVHFTSPIRRYADLLAHRALIAGLGLGAGGLPADCAAAPDDVAAHLTRMERRAAAAERDAVERHHAAFLARHMHVAFAARIVGVSRAALSVSLAESGASGVVACPVAAGYAVGQRVLVRPAAADPLRGRVTFALVTAGAEAQGGRPARR